MAQEPDTTEQRLRRAECTIALIAALHEMQAAAREDGLSPAGAGAASRLARDPAGDIRAVLRVLPSTTLKLAVASRAGRKERAR